MSGIYRGPGGTGDAVNDSSSETRLAVEARDAAIAAKVAAEAAQAAAETAETNAETAETNAETAETNAETAATNAASSASSASSSASSASSSASAASTSASNASTSASGAATSATNASNSATAAATSATNASNSATAAATSATNASNSASAASTSATNSANSATSASSSASTATTQATNASNSATAAATSATNAANSATSASTSASTATTQATNAANSATAAATSATNASNSASAASTSASNASTSATAAQSAQTAAESARDAALSAYDNFDDRYLGPKSSDPTLDNDGNALITGALYFNTATNVMKVYDGSTWVAAYVSAAGVLLAANNLSDLNNTSTARTNLGVAIGTDVQAYDADTAKLDVSQSWSAAQSFNAGVTLGDASGDALTINSSAVSIPNGLNFDSNTFVIDATNNNVGVGTASPTIASSRNGLVIRANSGNGAEFIMQSTNATNGTFGGYATAVTGNDIYYLNRLDGFFAWNTGASGGSERMRITEAGNVGIGTSSPESKFHVVGSEIRLTGAASKASMNLRSSSGAASWIHFTEVSVADRYLIGHATGSADLVFRSNSFDFSSGTERMRLDSSGNLGLGVTPSAWSGKAFDLGTTSGLCNVTGTGGTFLTNNSYNNGTNWIYKNTNPASAYAQLSPGTHAWYNAASGTAGNAITFTQAMTLDASGRLGIGSTSPATKLHIVQTTDNNTDGVRVARSSNTAQYGMFSNYGGATWLTAVDTAGLGNNITVFNRSANGSTFTESMRIDSSGNLGIGTSSPAAKLDVASEIRVTSGSNIGRLLTDGSNFYVGTRANIPMRFESNSTTQAILDTSGNFQFNSGYGSVATAYGCRAWVNFNGTGTVAIRASGNVSSITDNGTGDYTVNFSTAMPDANYSAIAVASGQYGTNMGGQIGMFTNATVGGGAETAPTTAATRFVFNNYSSNNYDAKYVSFAVFR